MRDSLAGQKFRIVSSSGITHDFGSALSDFLVSPFYSLPNVGGSITDSFKLTNTYFEIALPFILKEISAGQPFIETSIANKYGTTHLGLRFGFLF